MQRQEACSKYPARLIARYCHGAGKPVGPFDSLYTHFTCLLQWGKKTKGGLQAQVRDEKALGFEVSLGYTVTLIQQAKQKRIHTLKDVPNHQVVRRGLLICLERNLEYIDISCRPCSPAPSVIFYHHWLLQHY